MSGGKPVRFREDAPPVVAETVAEAAVLSGVTVRTLQRWIASGKVRRGKGGRLSIPEIVDAGRRWNAARGGGNAAEPPAAEPRGAGRVETLREVLAALPAPASAVLADKARGELLRELLRSIPPAVEREAVAGAAPSELRRLAAARVEEALRLLGGGAA